MPFSSSQIYVKSGLTFIYFPSHRGTVQFQYHISHDHRVLFEDRQSKCIIDLLQASQIPAYPQTAQKKQLARKLKHRNRFRSDRF